MENSNKSFEPMDVDLSTHSTSAMDISDSHPPAQIETIELDEDCPIIRSPSPMQQTPVPCSTPKTNIKTYHRKVRSQPSKMSTESKINIFISIMILLVSVVIYHCRIQCHKELDLEHLRDTLSSHVFGQAKAMKSIISAMEEDKKNKILFFYGGTGVGKTYTSSLIMDIIGQSPNLYHYTMPTFIETFAYDLKLGLIVCDSSVVIIDDLSVDNNLSEQINEIIAKSDNLKKNVTIILIHNCASSENLYVKKCDESLHSILMKTYHNEHASFSFIKFETLTDVHLRKCIDRELGDTKLDEMMYEKIIRNFNVTSDGCKGVHTKVKLLNMI